LAIATSVAANSAVLMRWKIAQGSVPRAISIPVATCAPSKVREYSASCSSTDGAPYAARSAPFTPALTL
jgi:hypothetical protein